MRRTKAWKVGEKAGFSNLRCALHEIIPSPVVALKCWRSCVKARSNAKSLGPHKNPGRYTHLFCVRLLGVGWVGRWVHRNGKGRHGMLRRGVVGCWGGWGGGGMHRNGIACMECFDVPAFDGRDNVREELPVRLRNPRALEHLPHELGGLVLGHHARGGGGGGGGGSGTGGRRGHDGFPQRRDLQVQLCLLVLAAVRVVPRGRHAAEAWGVCACGGVGWVRVWVVLWVKTMLRHAEMRDSGVRDSVTLRGPASGRRPRRDVKGIRQRYALGLHTHVAHRARLLVASPCPGHASLPGP